MEVDLFAAFAAVEVVVEDTELAGFLDPCLGLRILPKFEVGKTVAGDSLVHIHLVVEEYCLHHHREADSDTVDNNNFVAAGKRLVVDPDQVLAVVVVGLSVAFVEAAAAVSVEGDSHYIQGLGTAETVVADNHLVVAYSTPVVVVAVELEILAGRFLASDLAVAYLRLVRVAR